MAGREGHGAEQCAACCRALRDLCKAVTASPRVFEPASANLQAGPSPEIKEGKIKNEREPQSRHKTRSQAAGREISVEAGFELLHHGKIKKKMKNKRK